MSRHHLLPRRRTSLHSPPCFLAEAGAAAVPLVSLQTEPTPPACLLAVGRAAPLAAAASIAEPAAESLAATCWRSVRRLARRRSSQGPSEDSARSRLSSPSSSTPQLARESRAAQRRTTLPRQMRGCCRRRCRFCQECRWRKPASAHGRRVTSSMTTTLRPRLPRVSQRPGGAWCGSG